MTDVTDVAPDPTPGLTMRQIVTGVDEDGLSCVLRVGMPKDLTQRRSTGDSLLAGESVPLTEMKVAGPGEAIVGESWVVEPAMVQGDGALVGGRWMHTIFGPHTRAALHSTPTYDVDLIVAGEIDLLLQKGSVRLHPGDTVVIPGIVHGWSTDREPCSFMCTMFPDKRG